MQFSKRTGIPTDKPGEQLIEFPLAISDNTGNPLKGQKSYTTRSLESRYKEANPQVFVSTLPLADYARFLMTRYILTQFNKGSNVVHVIFDNPGRLQNTPKYFKHVRWDTTAKVVEKHCCDEMLPNTKVPNVWTD